MTAAAATDNHNDRIYGQFIAAAVPDIDQADRLWLANQLGKIYRKGWTAQRNFRLCADRENSSYTMRRANGKGPAYDVALINFQTGRAFLYGFNYNEKGKGNGHA